MPLPSWRPSAPYPLGPPPPAGRLPPARPGPAACGAGEHVPRAVGAGHQAVAPGKAGGWGPGSGLGGSFKLRAEYVRQGRQGVGSGAAEDARTPVLLPKAARFENVILRPCAAASRLGMLGSGPCSGGVKKFRAEGAGWFFAPPSDCVFAGHAARSYLALPTGRWLQPQVALLPLDASLQGQMIGFARATSDGVLSATVWDVAVNPAWQRSGLGRALMERLTKKLVGREGPGGPVHGVAVRGEQRSVAQEQLGCLALLMTCMSGLNLGGAPRGRACMSQA